MFDHAPGTGQAAGERAANVLFVTIVLALAWALKAFYSRATFEELAWLLAPTRRLVEALTGAEFAPESGRGYLSRDRLYQIAPACAGVNFMIVALTSLACGLVHTCRTWARRLALLTAAVFAAYTTTLLANAARIAIAMRLHNGAVSFGPLTPGRLHCIAGVAVYFLFLCALFSTGARVMRARNEFAL